MKYGLLIVVAALGIPVGALGLHAMQVTQARLSATIVELRQLRAMEAPSALTIGRLRAERAECLRQHAADVASLKQGRLDGLQLAAENQALAARITPYQQIRAARALATR